MRHLHPDELIDLAEGARPESSALHLQECETCRRELAGVRAMMAAVGEVDVPEPSPLFWSHFSARVRKAVASEGPPARLSWLERWSWSRLEGHALGLSALAVGACAIIVVSALLMARLGRVPAGSVGPSGTNVPVAEAGLSTELPMLGNDSSLELVADLTGDMDWEAAREGGFAPPQDAVEEAVTQLNDVERRELRRLLKEELARSN